MIDVISLGKRLAPLMVGPYKKKTIKCIASWMKRNGVPYGEAEALIAQLAPRYREAKKVFHDVYDGRYGGCDGRDGIFKIARGVFGDDAKASRFVLEIGSLLGDYKAYADLRSFVR